MKYEQINAEERSALAALRTAGLSRAEIARQLELSEKATESVLSRARQSFKERFRSLWDFEPGFIVD